MKVNSADLQDSIWIKTVDEATNLATVILRKDFQQHQNEEEETYYEFEETSVQVVDRPNLEIYVEQHFDELYALGELTAFENTLPGQVEFLLTIVTGLMLEVDSLKTQIGEVTTHD